MYYVLIRNDTPRGSVFEIADILKEESRSVASAIRGNGIRISAFIPSRDGTRFKGLEEAPIPSDKVFALRSDLNTVGYGLSGPYDSRSSADEFWRIGITISYLSS